jgi:UDP-N-acetylmuramate--alanine ligase
LTEVYFIGIGGIGMSALARYFLSIGVKVSGYDKTESELTRELVTEGALIHYDEDLEQISKEADFVVYTPAIPEEHKELVFYRRNNYNVLKRSDVLQAITVNAFNICTAGTHGKTTITTMVAHILRSSGYGCTAFLGGISVNYQTNFWKSENGVCVIEADEYDRSFLKLHPAIAIISAMDADHLDIYGTKESMEDAFVEFGKKISEGGLLVSKLGLHRTKDIKASRNITYSLQNNAADAYAVNIIIQEGSYCFDVQLKDKLITGVQLQIGGMHNVENAVAAISVANALGIDEEKIKAAIYDFKGVKRRFEYILPPVKQQQGAYMKPVLIDDYAHHPEELRALISSARTLFPKRVLTVIFQPHLYTRTRDLAEGFADVLSLADRVILLPIYPARELPIEGVSSEMILNKVSTPGKMLLTVEQFLNWMKDHMSKRDVHIGEVFMMAGAGNIDALVPQVKQIIEQA